MSGSGDELKGLSFAIITVSDRSWAGQREDLSGPALKDYLEKKGARIVKMLLVPDELEEIKTTLIALCDDPDAPEVILTTGGTGLSPRDVTPEATRAALEKEVPGLAEAMRAESRKKTPMAMLSRATCGIRKKTLIVNLPGSVRGALENLEVVAPALGHALEILRQKISDCQQSEHLSDKEKEKK
ncbi:MAG: MogA/MoaB family molybdenum cofactor biosynthesis protein [Candidatus Aminicenantes bacterium]|nr:MogA/MoaB family molybdenum cofactor biosynthesis protein [Candidatus Aminicenantes bacterium]